MKKLVLILVVLSVVFMSCASPVDEPEVVEPVNPFEGRWMASNGYITECRGNKIIHPDGNIYQTFEYDDTYYYTRSTDPQFSHMYTTYRYEFKENGTMLYLYWVPNVYNTVSYDMILQKIGD